MAAIYFEILKLVAINALFIAVLAVLVAPLIRYRKAAFAVLAIAWRMNVTRTLHGVMILVATGVWLVAPFALVSLGVLSPNYVFKDGSLVLLPSMNELPAGATMASLLYGTFGTIGVAVFYGRLYINELRHAEHKLSFQAWQLQQLVPPER